MATSDWPAWSQGVLLKQWTSFGSLLGTQFGHHRYYLQVQGRSQDHIDEALLQALASFRLWDSKVGRPKLYLEHKTHERRWLFNWRCVVMIYCCLLHQEKNHSKTAAKPPWKIAVMKLRDKDNQQKLKKECTRLCQDWKDKIIISMFGRTRS